MSDEETPRVVDLKSRRALSNQEAVERQEDWTPEDCLKMAMSQAATDVVKFNRCIVMLCKDTDDDFITAVITTDMKATELVGFLEVAKADALLDLNGIR